MPRTRPQSATALESPSTGSFICLCTNECVEQALGMSLPSSLPTALPEPPGTTHRPQKPAAVLSGRLLCLKTIPAPTSQLFASRQTLLHLGGLPGQTVQRPTTGQKGGKRSRPFQAPEVVFIAGHLVDPPGKRAQGEAGGWGPRLRGWSSHRRKSCRSPQPLGSALPSLFLAWVCGNRKEWGSCSLCSLSCWELGP